MIRRLALVAGAEEEGRRLDEVVRAWLGPALGRPVSKSAVRRLIMAGALSVGGARLRRPGRRVGVGERLVATVDLDRLGRARDVPFTGTQPRILYEDQWFLAVDKPAGLPTHPTADPSRPSLTALVGASLAARRGSEARPHLGVHQRLDRDTSGVLLFTRDREADAGLSSLFARREVVKVYHALTVRPERLPPRSWRCRARLAVDRAGRVVEDSRGAAAETEFRRLEVLEGGLLVEARPRTGRKHQIRVHLAGAGMPILGDAIYGGAGPAIGRLMLHARTLRLTHPVTGATLSIESPYPRDFTHQLATLRRRGRRS